MVHNSAPRAVLFAQASLWQPDLWLAVGALLSVVGLGIWAIIRVKRWREEEAESEPRSPAQEIEHYQQMVADGLLDPEEFARIKARLEPGANPPPTNKDVAQPPDSSIQEK